MTEDFPLPEDSGPRFDYSAERADDQRGKKVRLWIIVVLAACAVMFLGLDRYQTFIKPKLDISSLRKEKESAGLLEQDIRLLLKSYAIAPRYIRLTAINVPVQDSIRIEWFIQVAPDVPLASMTHDLNVILEKYGGSAHAVEDVKTRQVAVHAKIRERILHSLVFHRSSSVRRESGVIGLLVDGIEEAPSTEVEAYFGMTDPVACVLQGKRDSRPFYARLVDANKEIILHFHFLSEKQSESKFELSDDLPPAVIASRVKGIMREYPRAMGYYITSERSLNDASSIAEEALANSIMWRIPTADIQYIDRGSTFSQMSSRMNDLSEIAVREGYAVGILKLRDESTDFLREEIMRLQKRGFDFAPIGRVYAVVGGKTRR